MSLSSFLLKADTQKKVTVDKDLDDLFRSHAGPSTSAKQLNTTPVKDDLLPKRERKRKSSVATPDVKAKKSKTEKGKAADSEIRAIPKDRHISKSKTSDEVAAKSSQAAPNESEDDDNQATKSSRRNLREVHSNTVRGNVDSGSEEVSDSDDEGDPSKLVHESLTKGAKSRQRDRNNKSKYIPPDETPERRNARTIFVGNVPVEVTKSRPMQKQFKRHILSFVPKAKVESVRFRSVAFQNPTSKLPTLDDPANDKTKGKAKITEKEKDGRQHDRERAASWRAKDQDEEEPGSEKIFLTPKEKKRIAFINHEIHSGVDAVNAYVVFAHPLPDRGARPANVPPPAHTMGAYEAARLAAERCDGSVFMERTIRVDRVGKDAEEAGDASGTVVADPKATVFVGNLDFASKEEDLRVFFEGVVSAERGPPGEGAGESSGEDEDEEGDEEEPKSTDEVRAKKPRTWVKRVRIIRDKDTQLGKGFAYVQFVDRECVDEVLALEQDQLKFAKRKLRVQRCKTVPGSAKILPKYSKTVASSASTKQSPAQRPGRPTYVSRAPAPKGDPTLGTKISHLPKDERKKVKAADADRVARRMAKKKAKVLAEKGVKAKVDRERVRKRPGDKKGGAGGNMQKDNKKGRVRSGKALSKMNAKK